MVCDCIKNIFKNLKGTKSTLLRSDLKKPLIDPIEIGVGNFNSIPLSHNVEEKTNNSSQFWTCSMGNLHPNNQEYCQCLYISAINKFKQR